MPNNLLPQPSTLRKKILDEWGRLKRKEIGIGTRAARILMLLEFRKDRKTLPRSLTQAQQRGVCLKLCDLSETRRLSSMNENGSQI